MKRVLLLLLAGVLSVGLAACGGGFAGYDLETTAQALLDSGAFEDALDTLDEESACMVYGLDPEQVEDCVVYAPITAGAEEIAVLRMTDEDAAKAALEALKGRVEDQIAALKDYQPEEVGKLDGAILDRQGTTVLLAVPASHDLAQAALDALR